MLSLKQYTRLTVKKQPTKTCFVSPISLFFPDDIKPGSIQTATNNAHDTESSHC